MRGWAAAALCCLLPPQGGWALRAVSPDPSSELEVLHEHDVSSFVSDGGLLCTQGSGRQLAAHLASYKASPLGSAFRESVSNFSVSCEALGFGHGLAPDPCSGSGRLALSLRRAEDAAAVAEARQRALDGWRGRHDVNETLASLLADCSCHPLSETYQGRRQECEGLQRPGAWLHATKMAASNTPIYACYEGPYEYALRALATMKSTPFLVVHEADQIIPKGCAELGYSSVVAVADHCFPKLRVMRAGAARLAKAVSAQSEAQQVQALAAATGSFVSHFADFKRLVKDKGMDTWGLGAQKNGCQCTQWSEVGKSLKAAKITCGLPPVRDFWKG